MLDVGAKVVGGPGVMLRLGNHAGELAVHAGDLGHDFHVAGPRFHGSGCDERFRDVIDHHPQAGHAVGKFRDEGEMGWAEQEIVGNVAAGEFAKAVDNVGAQEPAKVGFVVHNVADTAEFGVAEALVENGSHVGVGEIYPGHYSADRGGLRSEVEQPPGFIEEGVGLYNDSAVEAAGFEVGFQIFREIVAAQHGFTRRHPRVSEAVDIPIVLVSVYAHSFMVARGQGKGKGSGSSSTTVLVKDRPGRDNGFKKRLSRHRFGGGPEPTGTLPGQVSRSSNYVNSSLPARYTRVVLSDLLSNLSYQPVPLRFGTSGRRGRVVDLSQLEIYINVTAELEFLRTLPRSEGGIEPGDEVFFAHDLRPSSTRFDDTAGGRGELCQAAAQAILDAGMKPVNLGAIPTPALAAYAWGRGRASVMITGSHIPFDLNGYKLNTSVGELLKDFEAPINEAVERVRARLYASDFGTSLFTAEGYLRSGSVPMLPVVEEAREEYIARYTSFFGAAALQGRRILVYQHSAVGRDLLTEVLSRLGAEVVAGGRSDSFVAIDTEAIDAAQLNAVQAVVDGVAGSLWAVVSTDGDSDRPLILGLEDGKVQFFGGDLVGMIVAGYLGADAVVVPITCNDSIDRGPLAPVLEPRTKIGSPFVVSGMAAARAAGKRAVCGWEANGGFLLGSDVKRDGVTLTALPTRDAFLPVIAVLSAAHRRDISLPALFAELPPRFGRAGLVRNFPRSSGRRIVELLSEPGALAILPKFFTQSDGFSEIVRLDYTDGVRMIFADGDVTHFRPSGNADEFRMYAVSDTADRASKIVELGVAEPDGIVRRMERALIPFPGSNV